MDEREMNDLLRAAFAPWDERSWDNLLETYPEAALALEMAVDAGLTAEQVRDYCAAQGYPQGIGHWMAQAVQHLTRQPESAAERQQAQADDGRRPSVAIHDAEPSPIDVARPRRFMEDDQVFPPITGEIVVSRTADGRTRLVSDARGIRFVQPSRTDE